jgi:uncharacterized protein VirK/YbjX
MASLFLVMLVTRAANGNAVIGMRLKSVISRLVHFAPKVHPEHGLGEVMACAKFVVRGLVNCRRTGEWFQILDSPNLRVAFESHPHILSKLQRPYLHRKLGKRRIEALRGHYGFMQRRFSAEFIRDVFVGKGPLLTLLEFEGGRRYGLRLAYVEHLEKEGDLNLVLMDEDQEKVLFSISFCVVPTADGGEQVFVGGIQGWRDPDAKARIVALTRAMHGLRPKAFLLVVLQFLTTAWGLNGLRAVSNEMHVFRHFHKRRHINADYDTLWEDSGGVRDGDRMFTLPGMPIRRDPADIDRSKRSMYRKRYEFLDELFGLISANAIAANPVTAPVLAVSTKGKIGKPTPSEGGGEEAGTSANVATAHPLDA